MARISSFIYCIGSERNISTDGKGEMINAVGVLSAITPEYVPGLFSFSIIFSLLDYDQNISNTIKVVLSDDAQKEIINSNEIPLPIRHEPDPIEIPNKYKGANVCMDMRNVLFEKEGVYKTTIYFNGNSIGVYEIYVKGRKKA